VTQDDYTLTLFVRIDDALTTQTLDPRSKLWPSEILTLLLLQAIKGYSMKRFCSWVKQNLSHFFPHIPERSRLSRLFSQWASSLSALFSSGRMIGIIDSFGIELIHPRREGRSEKQIGKKGISNHRWIVGAKLCLMIDSLGKVIDFDYDSANVYDGDFCRVLNSFEGKTGFLSDLGFRCKVDKPSNLVTCKKGEGKPRWLIETVLGQLCTYFHLKRSRARIWSGLEWRLYGALACYNLVREIHDTTDPETGYISVSLQEFAF
jgi:hypothetical protein